MGEIIDLVAKIKRYYRFTPLEIRNFLIIILVLAFIISMDEWGPGQEVQLAYGLFNFFNAMLVVTLSILFYNTAQRIIGLNLGYKVEYQFWSFGIFIALILAFISTALGKTLWVLIPGGILIHHIGKHRLGFFRYGLNYFGLGMIALSGPVASIVLAIIFKIISGFISTPLITKLIHFNLIFAVWQILPIPPLDGSKLFFGSRMVYSFAFFSIIMAAILLYVNIPIWMAVIGAVLIGIICWLLYYIFLERFLWKGG